MGELGRHEEALPAAEEAAGIYRPLAQARPAFLPVLAAALNNLANALSQLNRDKEASALRSEADAAVSALAQLLGERANDEANA